jgi:cysteine synthase B
VNFDNVRDQHMTPTTGKKMAPSPRVGESVLARIGNTPLLRLASIGREFEHVEICAKAEWFNPGGSVKDPPRSA